MPPPPPPSRLIHEELSSIPSVMPLVNSLQASRVPRTGQIEARANFRGLPRRPSPLLRATVRALTQTCAACGKTGGSGWRAWDTTSQPSSSVSGFEIKYKSYLISHRQHKEIAHNYRYGSSATPRTRSRDGLLLLDLVLLNELPEETEYDLDVAIDDVCSSAIKQC